jgi:hypothetical protein
VISKRPDVISKRSAVIWERRGPISVHDVNESVKALV